MLEIYRKHNKLMATNYLISVLLEDEKNHFYVTQITKTDLILFAIDR